MTPNTEAELAEAIKATKGPLQIIGGGTRPVGRPVEGDRLSVGGLCGISLYEPGALTMVAQSGTPISEIETALKAHHQRLAFEPMDHRGLLGTAGEPTIGGVAAANVSGPRRIQVGAARDHILGLRFVDGMGRIIKNGGRVMKNVTGYDLVKLLAGSHGTLGVLSEVSFKVLPVPETAASVLIHGLNVRTAVAAMSAALGSPFEVSGAAHSRETGKGDPVTLLRIEGFAESVAYRAGRLKDLLSGFGGEISIVSDPALVGRQWQAIRDVDTLDDRASDIWRVSVRPSDAPDLIEKLPENVRVQMDWGGNLLWIAIDPGTDLRACFDVFSGHATLVRASVETRQTIRPFQPEPAALATLTAGLRTKFDPRSILNPGLMS